MSLTKIFISTLFFLISFSNLILCSNDNNDTSSATLIYFPLDERFATRGMFINMM